MATNAKAPRRTALRAVAVAVGGGAEPNAAPGILDAAVRAFDEMGYERSSLSYIAELAGTSKSLVTYYFPNKRALAAAVIDLAYPGGIFMGSSRGIDDPLQAILWTAEHVATNVLHSPLARVALSLIDDESVGTQRAAGKYLGLLVRLTDYLDEAQTLGILANSLDTATQARYLLSGIVGSITVGLATGARLCMVRDAVQITRDRLDQIALPAPAREQ